MLFAKLPHGPIFTSPTRLIWGISEYRAGEVKEVPQFGAMFVSHCSYSLCEDCRDKQEGEEDAYP